MLFTLKGGTSPSSLSAAYIMEIAAVIAAIISASASVEISDSDSSAASFGTETFFVKQLEEFGVGNDRHNQYRKRKECYDHTYKQYQQAVRKS